MQEKQERRIGVQYKFKDSEIGRILRNLVVLVDTREQANDHIIKYFKEHNINYKKQKLDYGDYSCMLPIGTFEGQQRDIYFTNDIVVERKFCIDELAMNLKDKKTNINEVNQEIIDLLGKEYLQKVLKSDYNRFKQELTSINKGGISFFIALEDHLFDKHLENHAYRALYEPETLKARLSTEELLSTMLSYGIYIEEITDPTSISEFINGTMWKRKDMSIYFACRLDIPKITKYQDYLSLGKLNVIEK